jgi:hypothetical protein
VHTHHLGDSVFVWRGDRLDSFAVCHCGQGTEAGNGTCYIKFAAVRPSPEAPEVFDRLLDACEAFASDRGLSRMEAGVNLGRHESYRKMIARGYRTDLQGVAMHRPNEEGYNRPDVFLVDDWR